MNICRTSVLVSFALAILLEVNSVKGSDGNFAKRRHAIEGILGAPSSSLMNINNLAMWGRDDGLLERRPWDLNAGVTFQRGTATIVYAGGLVWGGLVSDGTSPQLRVGGQTYNYGTVPGRIISRGLGEDPRDSLVRIFRVRRDWRTADLTRDAAEFFNVTLGQVTQGEIDTLREQYKLDWIEWPWQKGAPYYDRNQNGIYDPVPGGTFDSTKDEPGLAGAYEVIWFVANDLDSNATRALYGSPPIGLEMQFTAWAYQRGGVLDDVIFERYRLIYKGSSSTPDSAKIDSMYFAKWVDPDIGDYGDDYTGCDTVLSLGFAYNSSNTDAVYQRYGLPPPAAGYVFLQGPLVVSSGDTAIFDLHHIPGYRNVPMTTFVYFAAGGHDSDPDLSNYEGTKQWYNLLRGFRPRPVDPPQCFLDITTKQCTHFELSGDSTTLQ